MQDGRSCVIRRESVVLDIGCKKMKTTKHNLSHQVMLTGSMGKLYPVGCIEVLPKDHIRHQVKVLLRLLPLVTPVMHSIDVRIHNWFVPTRILEASWDDFITGGADGNDATVLDTLSTGGSAAKGTLYDHFGIPIVNNVDYLAYPVYAYNTIYNQLRS